MSEPINALAWKELSWKKFQQLCIYVAENKFPQCDFTEFLKEGHYQEGIDLISDKNGKFITIQCKHVNLKQPTQIDRIIEEFLHKKHPTGFSSQSSHFIIATTADLQRPKFQQRINHWKPKLFKDNNIKFDVWDVEFLNKDLKKYYSIVSNFFSVSTADKYCFVQPKQIISYLPVADFVPRKVTVYKKDEDYKKWNLGLKYYDLKEFFITNRMDTKLLCLVADPNEGKSHLLKHLAFQLEQAENPYKCFLIELKSYNTQPIESLLSTIFGEWKTYSAKDITIILDGLDEVPTDQFDATVKHINEFNLRYPVINIIVSCRKIFFNLYRVDTVLKKFATYELRLLSPHEVESFLKDTLKEKYKSFMTIVDIADVRDFLIEPFYLGCILEDFKTNDEISSNKIEILNKFINNSYHISENRKLGRSKSIHHESKAFQKCIKKLAFALQLSGKNALSRDNVADLFNSVEVDLLQHCSLISLHNEKWSFTNAKFQEHLAAQTLAKMSFTTAISIVTIGNKTQKIKTKWLQTYASLLSLISDDTELHYRYLTFLQDDSIELVYKTEPNKYSSEFRIDVLERLLIYWESYALVPMLITEANVAIFHRDDDQAIPYLLELLESKDISVRNKISIIRILDNMEALAEYKEQLLIITTKELRDTSDAYYCNQILNLLAYYSLGNETLINDLINNAELCSNHYYRDGIYSLIIALHLADSFYDFALDGISSLLEHNKKGNHVGSQFNCENVLTATNSSKNYSNLLRALSSESWLDFYSYKSKKEPFFIKICKKGKELLSKDPLVVFPLIQHIRELGRKYIREEYQEFDDLFNETSTNTLAVRIILNDLLTDFAWEFATLIHENCFDYLLFEFEERNIEPNSLLRLCSFVQHRKKETGEKMFELCDDLTEGALTFKIQNAPIDEYAQQQIIKQQNDLVYIQSRFAFRKGIINYFSSQNTTDIEEDELYVDWEQGARLRDIDSNFVRNFIIGCKNENSKKIFLKDALKYISKNENFEYFRANQIVDYYHFNAENTAILKRILLKYYNSHINNAEFTNCYFNEIEENGNVSISYKVLETQLARIYRKFEFETPKEILMEMIWADTGGILGFEDADLNKKQTLSQVILGNLNNEELFKFKQTIVGHLNTPIISSQVLMTHINLCKHLKIKESKSILLKLLLANTFREFDMVSVMEIFLELGGPLSKLLPIFLAFKNYESHMFEPLSRLFIKEYPEQVCQSLIECLHCDKVRPEAKIVTAKYLSSLGRQEGFLILSNYIRTNKISPYTIQGDISIAKLDTDFFLGEIDDLFYLITDKEQNLHRFHESAKSILMEWLKNFACKSEDDMEKVVTTLMNKQKESKTHNPDLYWYIFRIIEDCRSIEKGMSIQKIKNVLEDIGY